MFRKPSIILLLLLIGAGIFSAQAQTYKGKQLVKASLLSSASAVVPGKTFNIGLLLEMAPKWHAYWEYPGDAGEAPKIEWKLPPGFSAGAIQWPLPEAVMLPGDILDYAYTDRVLLIIPITAPKDISATSVTLGGLAKWLVCADICVPGKEEVELTLPVAATANPVNEAIFSEFQKLLPITLAPPFDVAWTNNASGYTIALSKLSAGSQIQFFPLPAEKANFQHPEITTPTADTAKIQMTGTGLLNGGVIVVEHNGTASGYAVQPASAASSAATDLAPVSTVGIWMALFYGFLGGLILNLMPCVLPVISLKVFGFVKQAGDDPRKILRHGLAFISGIFLWFLGLGIVICILRSAGQQVTWAFQFQNPYFNLAISVLVLVFALNLFGVFEIVLPGSASSSAASLADRGGYAGSFFQGVFATLLATPCTAPFLGTALGFAFSQSNIIILAMFAAVAFGMAFPYFFLSANPGWMKFLPKPGLWMERVKQFMGFPLLATLLWLLFIIGQQKGIEALIWAACYLLILGVVCWIYGAFATPVSSMRSKVIALLIVILLIGFGTWYCIGIQFEQSSQNKADNNQIAWVPFSPSSLQNLLSEGKPVFLDFTADWCVTCKFNERFAINTPAVRAAFQKAGITPMQADWTNADPD
ncbi:MAG: protein-disulfide reductase DsbD domain-containing protein, partial [Chthoniobacterales bacterium]